jgi:hypothetical protein
MPDTSPLHSADDDPLRRAQRELRATEAAWRQKRAEVARLIAAGDEAAADAILRELGEQPPARAAQAEPSEPVAKPAARAARTALEEPHTRREPAPTTTREAIREAAKPRAARRRRTRSAVPASLGRLGAWIARKPPWAVSLATHATALALLAAVTFGSLIETPLMLTASLAPESDLHLADAPASEAEVELTSAELDDALESALDLASFDEPAQVAPLDAADLASPLDVGTTLAGDAESLMTSVGDGEGRPAGGGKGGEATGQSRGMGERVRFFGSESRANRIAFVVDNSGSMQRGRMETTLAELGRAVQGLTPSQSFYVVLFSDQPYPMLFPEADPGPLAATPENKRRLLRWLTTVEMCTGGRLTEAVQLASLAKPQVVYLLTDGDIRSPRVMADLTRAGAWEFTIHTLGMGVRTPQDAQKLDAIAKASGGSFRMVQAHPAAVQRSFARPMPYNRTPGRVWGSAVQAWTP